MTVAFFIFAVATVMTFFGLRFRAYVISAVAGAAWIFLGFYVQNVGLGATIPSGSPIDTGIFVLLVGSGALLGIFSAGSLFSRSNGESFRERAFGSNSQRIINFNGDARSRNYNSRSTSMDERQSSYRQLLRSKLNQPRKRR
jgi:hypothetical protein